MKLQGNAQRNVIPARIETGPKSKSVPNCSRYILQVVSRARLQHAPGSARRAKNFWQKKEEPAERKRPRRRKIEETGGERRDASHVMMRVRRRLHLMIRTDSAPPSSPIRCPSPPFLPPSHDRLSEIYLVPPETPGVPVDRGKF